MTSASIAVVVTCYNLGRTLGEALASIDGQTRAPDELIVVDDGSDDLFTRQVIENERSRGRLIIRTENRGVSAARNLGIHATSAALLVLLDADDTLESTYLEKAASRLERNPNLDFVSCGMRCHGSLEQDWYPDTPSLISSLSGRVVHISSMFRRYVWEAVTGFDEQQEAHEEIEFWTAATSFGFVGDVIQEPLLNYRIRHGSLYEGALASGRHEQLMDRIYQKHAESIKPVASELLLAKEGFILEQREYYDSLVRQQQLLRDELASVDREVQQVRTELALRSKDRVDFGDLRRTEPISLEWGLDRGLPVDRRFIHQFLDRHRADITGSVLEVKDSGYTRLFGSAIQNADVIDIDPKNPEATICVDLSRADSVPGDSYDCVILTQTLGLIFDARGALAHAARILKPGGVLLCTLPASGRLSPEGSGIDGDHWRFTEASTRALMAEQFPLENFTVEGFGNVLTSAAFLYGLADHEVPADFLDVHDAYFPIVYCVRAVKAEARAPRAAARMPRPIRAVLMYHRVSAEEYRDPLNISAARLKQQLSALVHSGFAVAPLQDVALGERVGATEDAVAITFDDGYRSSLEVAAPLLESLGLPATYFVVTGAMQPDFEFWWDLVERCIISEDLPESVSHQGMVLPLPVSTTAQKHRTLARLKEILVVASLEDRTALIDALLGQRRTRVQAAFPTLSEEDVRSLAARPGAQIGSHTVHHLWLPCQPEATVIEEVTRSRHTLESLTGKPVSTLAYPYGGQSELVSRLAASAGYTFGCTTEPRTLASRGRPLQLARIDATQLADEALIAVLKRPSAIERALP